MPLGLGLASSHAPQMFAPAEAWEDPYRRALAGKAEAPQAARETLDVIRGYVERIENAFQQLAAKLGLGQSERRSYLEMLLARKTTGR